MPWPAAAAMPPTPIRPSIVPMPANSRVTRESSRLPALTTPTAHNPVAVTDAAMADRTIVRKGGEADAVACSRLRPLRSLNSLGSMHPLCGTTRRRALPASSSSSGKGPVGVAPDQAVAPVVVSTNGSWPAVRYHRPIAAAMARMQKIQELASGRRAQPRLKSMP